MRSLGRALHWCEKAPPGSENLKLCSRLWVFSGDIRKDRGELVWALSSYSRAILLDECSVHAHINAAAIYHLKNDFSRALKHYAIAHQLSHNDQHHSLIRFNVAKLQKQFNHNRQQQLDSQQKQQISIVSLCNETTNNHNDAQLPVHNNNNFNAVNDFKFNQFSLSVSGLRCQLDTVSMPFFIRYF